MKITTPVLLAILGLALTGCGADEPAAAPTPVTQNEVEPDPDPDAIPGVDEDVPLETLVALAKAIRDNPDKTEELLADAGMHIGQFEAAMFLVAKQPEKARAFREAMK